MIIRSASLLTLLLPVIAVSWLIANAAMGLVAADRSVAAEASTVHIVSANQTSIAVETIPSRATVTICSPDGSIAAGIIIGHALMNLERLCQARLKFTANQPKP